MDALKLARLARAKELQEECRVLIAPIIQSLERAALAGEYHQVVCDPTTGRFSIYEVMPPEVKEEKARLASKVNAILDAFGDQFAKEFDGQAERLRLSSKNQ